MRWLVVACAFAFACPAYSQDTRIVRKWQGTLGTSQFGVFSKDGKRIVYAQINDVVVADTETGANEIKLIGHAKPVWLARFSADDKHIISVGQDDSIRVWDLETQKVQTIVETNTSGESSVLVSSRDSKLIVVSSGQNRQLKIISTLKGGEVTRLSLTENELLWFGVTPDLKFAMSGGIRNEVRMWNVNAGTSFPLDNGHHTYCAQFTHDGQSAVFGGASTWDYWDLRKKSRLKSGTVTGGHVYAIATSPNSSRFLTGVSDGTVWVWDLKTGADVLVLRGHNKPCSAAMISPDKSFAVTRDTSGEIILWRMPK